MLEHDWQGKGQDAPMFVFHSFVIHLQEEENDCHDSETHQQNTLQQGLLCEKNFYVFKHRCSQSMKSLSS